MFKSLLLALLLVGSTYGNNLSVNQSVMTDYMARGTSQTLGQFGYSLGVDYNFGTSGFYVGSWTCNVDFGDGTDQEIDGWVGYRKTKGNLTIDTNLNIYGYTNDPVPYEMFEWKIAFTEVIGKFTLTETLAYSPEYFNILNQSVWGEFNVLYNITKSLSISSGVGYQHIQGGGSYGCYNVGVNYRICPFSTIDVRWYDNNDHGQGKAWDSALVFALRTTF